MKVCNYLIVFSLFIKQLARSIHYVFALAVKFLKANTL